MATMTDAQRQQNVNQAFSNLASTTLSGYGGINAGSNFISSLIANASNQGAGSLIPLPGGASPTTGGATSTAVPRTSGSTTRVTLPASAGGGGASVDLGALTKMLSASSSKIDPIVSQIQGLLSGFTKDAAFSDATALMNQRAQLENQKNQPVIQRAVEGAGTSGSSMSALLAQRFAADTAQNAAALGAEQAKAYGGISANLSGMLAQLVASGDPMSKILAGILQTGMQTDASTRNAEIDAASRQYAVDNQRSGTALAMPVESRTQSPMVIQGAPSAPGSSPFSSPWYQTSASSFVGGPTGTSRY